MAAVTCRKLTPWMIGVGGVTFSPACCSATTRASSPERSRCWTRSATATFFIFAALCVVSFVFVWYHVPETEGRSLEDQERWVESGDRMLDESDLRPPPNGPGAAVPG